MSIKQQCLRKAQDLCANCGNQAKHAHHIVPLSIGGTDKLSNLVALCEKCHSLIHDLRFTNHSHLTKQGLKKAKENGKKLGGLRPKTIEANNSRRKQNLQKALEYREILELKEKGLSYRSIASLFNENKRQAPSGNTKWYGNLVWRLHKNLIEIESSYIDKQN
jgi:hypothetical protein